MNTTPSNSTFDRLRDLLIAEHDLKPEKLHESTSLESLGIDSLGTIELLWMVEEQFNIELPTEPAQGLETLGDIVDFIDTLVEEQHAGLNAPPTMAPNALET